MTWLSRITKESYQLWMRDVEILARSLTRWVNMLTCRYMKVLLCWHFVLNKLYNNLTKSSHQKLSIKSSEIFKCPLKTAKEHLNNGKYSRRHRNWRLKLIVLVVFRNCSVDTFSTFIPSICACNWIKTHRRHVCFHSVVVLSLRSNLFPNVKFSWRVTGET